jgi:hypothetical protein
MIDNFILLIIGLFIFSVIAVIGECIWGDK